MCATLPRIPFCVIPCFPSRHIATYVLSAALKGKEGRNGKRGAGRDEIGRNTRTAHTLVRFMAGYIPCIKCTVGSQGIKSFSPLTYVSSGSHRSGEHIIERRPSIEL